MVFDNENGMGFAENRPAGSIQTTREGFEAVLFPLAGILWGGSVTYLVPPGPSLPPNLIFWTFFGV